MRFVDMKYRFGTEDAQQARQNALTVLRENTKGRLWPSDSYYESEPNGSWLAWQKTTEMLRNKNEHKKQEDFKPAGHRIHEMELKPDMFANLGGKRMDDWPLVGINSGTVLCGPNMILTDTSIAMSIAGLSSDNWKGFKELVLAAADVEYRIKLKPTHPPAGELVFSEAVFVPPEKYFQLKVCYEGSTEAVIHPYGWAACRIEEGAC